MRTPRLARSCALGIALAALACEPLEEAPPPASPANAYPPPESPPANPPEATQPAAPGAGPAGYASDEVTLGAETDGYDDDDPAALTDFRPSLEGHGTWADDPTYGTVWIPSPDAVGPNFQPYVTAGHWTYDEEWVWVSDYDWGWGPFHYGRWVYLAGRGWAWIPGRAYRGAWVAWSADDVDMVVGWAPLGPTFLWFGGAPIAYGGYLPPRWVYCPRRDVFTPTVGGHVIAGAAAARLATRTRPVVLANPAVGPTFQSLGLNADEASRSSAAAGAGIARAREFARPTAAESLGARAPTRPVAIPRPVATPVAPVSRPQPSPAPPVVRPQLLPGRIGPAPVRPTPVAPAPAAGVPAAPTVAPYRAPPAPVVRPSPGLAPRAPRAAPSHR